MKLLKTAGILSLGTLVLVFTFQNCSGVKYDSLTKTKAHDDIRDEVHSESEEELDFVNDDHFVSHSQNSNSDTDTDTDINTNNNNIDYTVITYTGRINIVHGGGLSSCNSKARNYNPSASCSLGGGCARDGTKPSSSNISANPQHYGACVDITNHEYFFQQVLGGRRDLSKFKVSNPYGFPLPSWVRPYEI